MSETEVSMKSKHLLMAVSLLVVLAMLVGCAAPATPVPAATTSEQQPAAEPAAATAAKPFIPVISKGFQHQFWQAVKQGAEQAAADYNVDITFEGPATEAEVDKQIEMLQAALAKNPQAICFAALDSQAAIPLLEEARPRASRSSASTRRGQRHPGCHRSDRQHRCRRAGGRQDGRADRRVGQGGRAGA
jgi:ABC-type sugar transport system substrate-binding protein